MRKQALIYGREPQKKVTKYQQLINDAAAAIVIENPALLSSRSKLLELARGKVDNDGYVYKKGKSRSKKLSTTTEAPPKKRPKTVESFRLQRISQLQEDVKDINDRLQMKEKRRDQASNSRNYKLCDEIMEEMSTIKQKKREYETELQKLQRKQDQSSWYKNQKNTDTSSLVSNSSESLTEPSGSPSPKRKRKSTSCASTSGSPDDPVDLSSSAHSSDSEDIDERSSESEKDPGTSEEHPFP